MDHQRLSLRIGAAAILCALLLRLCSTGFFRPVAEFFAKPDIAAFLVYLETGRKVRFSPSTEPVAVFANESAVPDFARETAATTEPPEKVLPVFAPADTENLKFKNSSGLKFDPEELISEPLQWNLAEGEPAMLILHTHATESYTKDDGEDYKETSAFRTLDEHYNMVSVGEHLGSLLEEGGITVLHDRQLHDYPSYNGSYSNARKALKRHLKENPSLAVDYIAASPRMAKYMEYSTRIYSIYLRHVAPEDIHVYSIDEVFIDRSFPEDNAPTRKPRTGMLGKYLNNPEYDLAGSFVIGDRYTDVELAKNLGCKAIYLQDDKSALVDKGLEDYCALATKDWDKIAEFLFAGERVAEVRRKTNETDIYIKVDLDGSGKCNISTGLGFFDHMLEQIGKHGSLDLTIQVKGDLEVDEHHTIEDTALALGECLLKALGDKRGIERYGYCLPMDDCLCQVALDFGGRPWLVWDTEFHREKIGEMPTEMFLHFFKSLSDSAKMNLNIKAEGQNEHHKIEGIFKALARAIKMAVKRDIYHFEVPSSKGSL